MDPHLAARRWIRGLADLALTAAPTITTMVFIFPVSIRLARTPKEEAGLLPSQRRLIRQWTGRLGTWRLLRRRLLHWIAHERRRQGHRSLGLASLCRHHRDIHRTVVLVVGAGRAVDNPTDTAAQDDVANSRARDARVVEVGRLLVALLHARDPNVVLRLFDQSAARRVLDGRDTQALPIQSAVSSGRIGVHHDLLASTFDDCRASAGQHARSNRGNGPHLPSPSWLSSHVGPRQRCMSLATTSHACKRLDSTTIQGSPFFVRLGCPYGGGNLTQRST